LIPANRAIGSPSAFRQIKELHRAFLGPMASLLKAECCRREAKAVFNPPLADMNGQSILSCCKRGETLLIKIDTNHSSNNPVPISSHSTLFGLSGRQKYYVVRYFMSRQLLTAGDPKGAWWGFGDPKCQAMG
jgi:hypothetical protein